MSPKTADELKPCPFCGHDKPSMTFAVGEYWVICDSCKGTTRASGREELARDDWNRRAAEQRQAWPDVAECGKWLRENNINQEHDGVLRCFYDWLKTRMTAKESRE